MQIDATKGLSAVRYFRSLRIAGGDGKAAAAWIAGQRFRGADALMELLQKAGVSDTHDADLRGRNPVLTDLAGAVRSVSVLGQLPGVVELPFQSSTIGLGAGVRAYWRARGQAVPVSNISLSEPQLLDDRGVYALLVARDEFLRDANPMAERALAAELIRAVAEALDQALVDPDNDGTGDAPESITHGGHTTPSTGSSLAQIDTDLSGLVEELAHEDLSTARWVLHPRSAAFLATLRGTGGALAYPGIGVRGGELLGIPAIVSRGVPVTPDTAATTSISLLIGSGIVVAGADQVELRHSKHATLEMDSQPTGHSITPAAQSQYPVSMFQNDLTALMAIGHANWKARRSTVAATLTGVSY